MVELIWERKGLVRRFSGAVSEDELDGSALRLQSNIRLDDLRYIIHDFTDAGEITASREAMEYMGVRASFALQNNPRVRIAFVGSHPAIGVLMDGFNNKGKSAHQCVQFATIEAAWEYVLGGV